MEYLILGLLILSPMTGYQLQQFIKKILHSSVRTVREVYKRPFPSWRKRGK